MNDREPITRKRDGAASDSGLLAELLGAVKFAADKHRDQRRKGAGAVPYINHPVEVAELLARVGGVSDFATLQAAILHDTIEDTETEPEELEAHFGPEVRQLVEEVTDDKGLDKEVRKTLQITHTPHLSAKAKRIKLADKICNVRDIAHDPPPDWTLDRRQKYLEWSSKVVAGCRGSSPALERAYDACLSEAGRVMMSRP